MRCRGEATIVDSVITGISFRGSPRLSGDEWVEFFIQKRTGSTVSKRQINSMLAYDGKNDVCSWFKQSEDKELIW